MSARVHPQQRYSWHTVGKYPSVKTLSRLVLPHAPSPMITSFLRMCVSVSTSVVVQISNDQSSLTRRSAPILPSNNLIILRHVCGMISVGKKVMSKHHPALIFRICDWKRCIAQLNGGDTRERRDPEGVSWMKYLDCCLNAAILRHKVG